MKKIKLDEHVFSKLFESNEEFTPQLFIKTLYKEYKCQKGNNKNITQDEFYDFFTEIVETNEDIKEFKNFINYNFYATIHKNPNKIYVERAISINSYFDIMSYDGLGTSWSWAKNGAEAYFGYGSYQIILQGYVSFQNVDWEKSIFLNSYPLQEQQELRIKTNNPIMLSGFIFNGKSFKLKQLIPLTSGSIDIGI